MNGPKTHGGNLTGHGVLLLAMDTGGQKYTLLCHRARNWSNTQFYYLPSCFKNDHNIITSKHKDILEITS